MIHLLKYFYLVSVIVYNINCDGLQQKEQEQQQQQQEQQQQQPNIIFFMIDDLGWSDVGFNGENQIPTPNIDSIAYNGIILNKHYVLPTCSPSRAAFLTGKYPVRHGIQLPIGAGVPIAIPPNEKLLPQYLKELGYSTHLVGKWHVGCHRTEFLPLQRGFDSHLGFYNGYLTFNSSTHTRENPHISGFDARFNGEQYDPKMSKEYLTNVLNDRAIDIIKSHKKSKPLYLQFNHAAVHASFATHNDPMLEVPNKTENDLEFSYIKNSSRRLFAGMMKSLDDSVGRVIQSLDQEGLLKNSIIVFISDNGGPTRDDLHFMSNTALNSPLRGAKFSVYDGGVRGVAAIWSPLFKTQRRIDKHLMHITDWLPTFYHLAGGNISNLPNDLDGIDQTDHLIENKDSKPVRDTILVHFLSQYNDEALIHENWKIIKVNSQKEFGFAHVHYTSEDNYTTDYNRTKVLNSITNNILSKYGQNKSSNITLVLVDELRNEASVKCNVSRDKKANPSEDCREKYCLYNLNVDPCEYNDIASKNNDKVAELKLLLDQHRHLLNQHPLQNYSFDNMANPIFWNGYWTTWKQDNIHLLKSNQVTNPQP